MVAGIVGALGCADCRVAIACGPLTAGVKLLFGGCIIGISDGENAWNAVGNETPG
jgi:hypothetical protein